MDMLFTKSSQRVIHPLPHTLGFGQKIEDLQTFVSNDLEDNFWAAHR